MVRGPAPEVPAVENAASPASASALLDALARALEVPGAPVVLALAALAAAALLASAWLLGRARRSRRHAELSRIATAAVQQSGEGLLALMSERFRFLEAGAAADLDGRQRAIEDVVKPLSQAIADYRGEARVLENARREQTGALGEQLRSLAEETSKLSGALRAPGARGRWGELTLRRTAELAGLSEHCDFAEQVSLAGAQGAARPDMLVRLPAGREIAVDAKAPLDAYLAAADATSDDDRQGALRRHARHVKRHVETLAARDYAARLGRAPDFVVLFLPDDGFLAGAVLHDRDLVESALRRGVVIATPATLYALLVAVAQGWREARLAENTQRILAAAREMDDRLGTFVDHLSRLGRSLDRSLEAYNEAVGSFDSRVLPQARRMRELGVDGRKAIDAPEPLDRAPRSPRA